MLTISRKHLHLANYGRFFCHASIGMFMNYILFIVNTKSAWSVTMHLWRGYLSLTTIRLINLSVSRKSSTFISFVESWTICLTICFRFIRLTCEIELFDIPVTVRSPSISNKCDSIETRRTNVFNYALDNILVPLFMWIHVCVIIEDWRSISYLSHRLNQHPLFLYNHLQYFDCIWDKTFSSTLLYTYGPKCSI